ncbi:hypothetical protein [Methylopila turkensis]|uniref:Uncharacterized protein n=1 Tax=Methylopila turkensis TaxID=1437816 RepID=A0A9W6JRH5_9HYPH|nr:hypothetical protein [Methylopila turkensis]GLK81917.1 hypothetical protein GCM10008174_36580 [Methylopila turkensis]
MRLSVLVLAATLAGAMTTVADAHDRRVRDRDGWRERAAATERRPHAERRVHRAEPRDDRPWGPIHPSQDDVRQSMYDFSTGGKGNIKEYWWRY